MTSEENLQGVSLLTKIQTMSSQLTARRDLRVAASRSAPTKNKELQKLPFLKGTENIFLLLPIKLPTHLSPGIRLELISYHAFYLKKLDSHFSY